MEMRIIEVGFCENTIYRGFYITWKKYLKIKENISL